MNMDIDKLILRKLAKQAGMSDDKYIDFGQIYCTVHGYQSITEKQYDDAMNNPDDHWHCPLCNKISEWVDQDIMEDEADYNDQPF